MCFKQPHLNGINISVRQQGIDISTPEELMCVNFLLNTFPNFIYLNYDFIVNYIV